MNRSLSTTSHWWKLLAGGSAVLVGFVVVTTITGDVGDSAWLPAMILLLGAVVTIAIGVVLGAVRLTETRSG